jgi:hypothetical protein
MAYTTAQLRDKIIEARDAAADRLVDVLADPKPSYSIDGETVQWSAYADMLQRQIEKMNQLAQQLDPGFQTTQFFT